MISFIEGTVDSIGADYVILDNHGMGYKMQYAHTSDLKLNEKVKLYTYMHISENDISLFAFNSVNEQDLFLKLISVKGLGPKTAISMLAKTSVNRLISVIDSGDVTALKTVPGIGNKTASQIILDLKGKLVSSVEESSSAKYSEELSDAIEALKNLGYKQADINQVTKYLSKEPGLTTEKYLKMGLQYINGRK